MEDAILLVIAFVAGAFVGWKANNYIHLAVMSDILSKAGITPERLEQINAELEKEVDSEETDERIEIRVEKHSGVLYAFRKDNDQFLGQGTDLDSLTQIIAERFRNVNFVVRQDDGADLLKGNPTS